MELLEQQVCCPYCWQSQTLLIDDSIEQQSYTEDCQICCQPMLVRIDLGANLELQVERENS
jgi:hypothetical protein